MPIKDKDKRREYQREYMRRWYQNNRAKHIAYVRNRDKRIDAWLDAWLKEYKLSLCCLSCGETHPACLEFHHINPQEKKFTIGRLERRVSLKSLQEEIAKCRVLCANCHRKEHYKQRIEQAKPA